MTQFTKLDALLMAIAFARRNAGVVAKNQEDGPVAFVLRSSDWNAILECASHVGTEITLASDGSGAQYVPKGEDAP